MTTSMTEMFSLSGHVAFVTGASSGLGRHFVGTLARAGATVVAAARRLDRLSALVEDVTRAGGKAHAVAMDVTDSASVAAALEAATSLAGIPDIIVNNAGLSVSKPLLAQTEEDWDTVIDTNLKGCWLVATEAARRLVAAEMPGTIVNIASILGIRVAGGVAPYAISKAGLVQGTKAMALELARHDIRVNAMLPGYVVTDLNAAFLASPAGEKLRGRIPTRSFCRPEDLDGALLLLASDAGRAMTGSSVVVDRGHAISGL